MKHLKRSIICTLLLLTSVGVAAAQEEPPPGDEPGGPPDAELRRAMQEYFHNQLRMELALSDEQIAEIAPKLERIEQARVEARRERVATVRQLQRGLREGGADDELQSLLDRLDRIEVDQREAERVVMKEIDEQLTVRQRVKFRFFIQRFRRELQRRVEQLRRQRFGDGEGQFRPPRRPYEEQP
jgi:hypothetical protein